MGPVITDAVPLRQWPPKLDEVEANKGNSSRENVNRVFDMNAMPQMMEIETNYMGSKENSLEEGLWASAKGRAEYSNLKLRFEAIFCQFKMFQIQIFMMVGGAWP